MTSSPIALIVDDSLTVRMDLAEGCEAAGFETRLAGTVAEARALLASTRVALAIFDLQLPDGDGFELLREVRESRAPDPPLVFLLANETELRERLRKAHFGADAYFGKPYEREALTARALELVRVRRAAGAATPTTVLIVDDSVTFREELKAALEAANYAVVTAASGEEGLRVAARVRPAAILVDNVMPGIDGSTVIRRIRLDSALRATPCVLLTASDDSGAELSALDAGADAFVRKDDLEVVLARISAVLRATSLEPTAVASALGQKRILVIEESADQLQELASVLRGEGYEVAPARSAEAGLQLLAAEQFDCILLDLAIPGVGGIETCRTIKGSQVSREVPLILLTAAETRSSMIEALDSGADDFIAKSVASEVLKARVLAQLRRKQFEDESRSIREKQLQEHFDIAEARAARNLAETRAQSVTDLEKKNQELTRAYSDLQTAQGQLVQAAKLASLGELVAGVAHEINNPLAFVISHLGTVRRTVAKLDAGVRETLSIENSASWERATTRLGEMEGGLVRMRDLVLKLRTFSRLDEGERKVVSITESVESLLTILQHRLQGRIEVRKQYGTPDLLDCYPGPLTQAIMNLVTNAIDAIEGQGVITISTGSDGDQYRIAVIDSGTGIPASVKGRILDPFFTTKPVGQGTGLGLSISYSIVQRHGGTLTFQDASGGGTEATIRIPLVN